MLQHSHHHSPKQKDGGLENHKTVEEKTDKENGRWARRLVFLLCCVRVHLEEEESTSFSSLHSSHYVKK
jgi:hypothetical protein